VARRACCHPARGECDRNQVHILCLLQTLPAVLVHQCTLGVLPWASMAWLLRGSFSRLMEHNLLRPDLRMESEYNSRAIHDTTRRLEPRHFILELNSHTSDLPMVSVPSPARYKVLGQRACPNSGVGRWRAREPGSPLSREHLKIFWAIVLRNRIWTYTTRLIPSPPLEEQIFTHLALWTMVIHHHHHYYTEETLLCMWLSYFVPQVLTSSLLRNQIHLSHIGRARPFSQYLG